MGKRNRKRQEQNSHLADDSHLLNQIADLVISVKNETCTEEEKDRLWDEIYGISEEIHERSDHRKKLGMKTPFPNMESREKLLALTDHFGNILFIGLSEEKMQKLDLPLANYYFREHEEWESDAESNPYSEILSEAEIFVDNLIATIDITSAQFRQSNTHAELIVKTLEMCSSCWNAKKRFGIVCEIEDMATKSSHSADLYAATLAVGLTQNEAYMHMDSEEISSHMRGLHLCVRQSALLENARFNAQIEDDREAARMLLGALAACGLRIANNAIGDEESLSESTRSAYRDLQSKGYEMILEASSEFLSSIALEDDIEMYEHYTYHD